MIIAVFGPRDHKGEEYRNYNYVADVLDEFEAVGQMVSGGGKGVEQLALRYAADNNIPHDVVPPNIKAFGKKHAFVKRNEEILEKIDIAIILWDGKDSFYTELMSSAIEKRKIVHVRHVE